MPLRSCPRIVGRDQQRQTLRAAAEAALAGGGRMVLLTGEHGIGKSCLARDLAAYCAGKGVPTLVGRAVDRENPEPFRPLTEALFAGLRDGIPSSAGLEPFLPALSVLFPQLRPAGVAAEHGSLLVLAEGMLRLLRALAGQRGLVLVLEDLHWADLDTLAVLEYLVDHLAGQRVLLLITTTDGAALRARAGELVELGRLNPTAVGQLALGCLDTDELPESLLSWLVDRADGMPYLVEELLASAVSSGALRAEVNRWSFDSPEHPLLPAGFLGSVRARLAALDERHLDVLHAAAVLGYRFDARLLPALTGHDPATVATGLRVAVELRLLHGADSDVSTHSFGNLLTHEAMLDQLPGYQRAELAAKALAEVEAAHPELPGDWCDVAADLAEVAGDRRRCITLLLRSGRRHAARGALAVAEPILWRARSLLDRTDEARVEVADELVRLLFRRGQPKRATEIGVELFELLDRLRIPVGRFAQARLTLAMSHALCGNWALADTDVELARATAGDAPHRVAAVEVVAARLAFDRSRVDEASTRAANARQIVRMLGIEDAVRAAIYCAAETVLGEVECGRDSAAAQARFASVLRIAERHDLVDFRWRALHQLGALDLAENLRVDRLTTALDLATDSGALAVAAVAGLNLAAALVLHGKWTEAADLAERWGTVAAEYGLVGVLPLTLVVRATVAGTWLRPEEMDGLIARALACQDVDHNVHAWVWGWARAEYALASADRHTALRMLDTAIEYLRHPAAGPAPARGLWALVATVNGRDDAQAREEVRGMRWGGTRMNRAHLHYAEAVAHGRAGSADLAMAAFHLAEEAMSCIHGVDWLRQRARWLIAEPAIVDGWGDPASWLRAGLDAFTKSGHRQLVSSCRSLLGRAGVPVPRHGGVMPQRLAGFGLTYREYEVLALLGGRLTNSEIAARLVISKRTVEKHVERLLRKMGVAGRTELAVFLEDQ